MLRFVASVMFTSGVLLVADAAVTLAWQEPISALVALREQAKLEDQLDDLTRRRRTRLDRAAREGSAPVTGGPSAASSSPRSTAST
ncbi:MAG: hypothetical protein ACRDL0_22445 [Thermoleophilaceae bacterium]